MSPETHTAATIDDLYRVDGKAELIGRRIVHLNPTGRLPNLVAGRIYRSLAEHFEALGRGEAYTDNMGFAVRELTSGRRTFSPDVSCYFGPFAPDPMRFIEGVPPFAVEVRSEGDYGFAAEEEMAAKRADYFEAGSLVIWDVDPVAETICIYRKSSAVRPEVLRRGDVADAEPAVADWRVPVDRVFGPAAKVLDQIT
jgi:Uma2 family endonuclease